MLSVQEDSRSSHLKWVRAKGRGAGRISPPGIVENMDVFVERTWTYSQRIPGGLIRPAHSQKPSAPESQAYAQCSSTAYEQTRYPDQTTTAAAQRPTGTASLQAVYPAPVAGFPVGRGGRQDDFRWQAHSG